MMKIKKMTLKDRKRVIDITKNIWDGDDYLPLVFDKWVKDKKGEFVGAIDEKGKLVGFEKLTMVSENDAWIEGLRKDLKSGVKGVGKFLSNYFIEKLKNDKKIKTIRFSTYFRNVESIGLFQKIGFKVLERRNNKFYTLPKLKSIPVYKGNRVEIIKDEKLVLDYFKRSKSAKLLKNGLNISWVLHPVTDDLIIDEFIKTGKCLGIIKKGRIKALGFYMVREKNELFISYFSADSDRYAKELFQKMKQITYINHQKHMNVIIHLKDKECNRWFKQFGFRSWEEEEDFLLFDLPIK
ncbi:MAG: GNAT family N-acetyltransferase [Candidatus Delongbacteria bacterium]|nr:GNAT family N-acetyltransferase [Candidatus Delongbacteria bacterium]